MPPQPGTMRSRWTAYAALSTALAAGVVLKSLAQRPNFYSAAVYLSQSSANLMILCNLVFVTACTVLLFLQKLFYGPLRPIETEQLYEKAWFAVTETCLAMTIFRGEIGAWFLVMFFSLLAGKVWGWIGEGRVEVFEQQQHNLLAGRAARLFHTRLAMSLALSVIFDLTMLEYVVGQVLHMARPDMMVMFGFEFAVLTITSLSTAMRYGINLVEIGIVRKQKQKKMDAIRKGRVDAAIREAQAQQSAPAEEGEAAEAGNSADAAQRVAQAAELAAAQPVNEADVEVEGWEGKGRWTFYLDLATDFFKLVVYLSFFFILLIFYGLPLHIMRDVFLTCRSFFKRIGDFVRYRTATKDMNERYPDATEADIGREDVCIICREEMRPYIAPAQGAVVDPVAERMRPKKLPCGHTLHFSCLRSWLERQQICPTCRATVVPAAQPRAAAAGGQAGVARGQHPPNGGGGQPRVYQFGPLRIGVGAARGNNMFEELEQQLANVNPPAPDPAGNIPQQYGFGIRWDGIRRRPQTQHRQHRGDVQNQLNSAERQLQREVDALQASMGELQALRNVQAQLNRIRMARAGQAAQQPPNTAATLPISNPELRPVVQGVTGLVANQQAGVLQAGSDQLPQGLILPEGWSMMPLQPIQPQPVQTQPMTTHTLFQHQPGVMHLPGMGPPPFVAPGPLGQLPPNPDLQNITRTGNESAQAAAAQLVVPNNGQVQQNPNQNRQSGELAQPAERTAEAREARTMVPSLLNNPTTPAQPSPSLQRTPLPAPQARSPLSQTQRQIQQRQPPMRTPVSPQAPSRPGGIPSTRSGLSNASRPLASTSSASSAEAQPATATDPLQKLNPLATNGSRTTSTSPHRPSRSIGSSWGFNDVENDEDEDAGSEDEEEEEEEEEPSARHTNGNPRSIPSGAAPTIRPPATAKGKGATVEDLSDEEDPD